MQSEENRPLRRGWTTGACATAAAKSAFTALVTGAFPDPVEIILPRGQTVVFALAEQSLDGNAAMAAVIKDAGDDPDVTHGATIRVTVQAAAPGTGVSFQAGEGVGTVTRAGLPLPVGEPAINPVPRSMITGAIEQVAAGTKSAPDVTVTVSIPGGEKLAERTMNGRLGIVGGLSILGTTGIVIPFSCAAWIASIHQGVDVARAGGLHHVAAATGSTSEAAVRALYGLPDHALIDMGDFAGGMLKYLRKHPLDAVSLAGGFAKISKLAQGHMDLHSGRSQVDLDWLAGQISDLGADAELAERCRHANTAMEVLSLASGAGLPLADRVAAKARQVASDIAGDGVDIEVLIYDRKGGLVGRDGTISPR
jgi:cobalt-precorrin-5B (C1)-methyltransferase